MTKKKQEPCTYVPEGGEPCELDQRSRGLCEKHYRRWLHHGDPGIENRKEPLWYEGTPNRRSSSPSSKVADPE